MLKISLRTCLRLELGAAALTTVLSGRSAISLLCQRLELGIAIIFCCVFESSRRRWVFWARQKSDNAMLENGNAAVSMQAWCIWWALIYAPALRTHQRQIEEAWRPKLHSVSLLSLHLCLMTVLLASSGCLLLRSRTTNCQGLVSQWLCSMSSQDLSNLIVTFPTFSLKAPTLLA